MNRDILILGGGPAGLSTALHLARHAPELIPRILLLEQAHYPRHKLCAGALTADAEVILQGLGLDVTQVPHIDASEVHLDFGGRGLVVAPRKAHVLRIIRREQFDAWLAGKARASGIHIREGVTARRVEPGPDSVRVETTAGIFEAAVVVGADGSNGITRRCILPGAPIHTARALEGLIPVEDIVATERSDPSRSILKGSYPGPSAGLSNGITSPFHVVSEREYAGGSLPPAYSLSENFPPPPITGEGPGVGVPTHAANLAYFDFAPVALGIAGYTWDFPTQFNGKPFRCWGVYDSNLLASHSRPPLRTALQAALQRHGASLDQVEVQGHPIRWFSPRSLLSVPRIILVGDAAGADGIFGEGISIALGYGRIAAEAIREALTRGDYSFGDYRRRILRSPLGRALIVRTAITHIFYRLHWAWFQRLFWRVLKPIVAAAGYVFVLNWARRMR